MKGLGAPAQAICFLPFMDSDEVLVAPSRARGQVVGWKVFGARFRVDVFYRVALAATPSRDELYMATQDLRPVPPT